VTEGAAAPEGPLALAGLIEDGSVIHALTQVSDGRISPRDADELEIWEIAVVLGHARELASPEDRHAADATERAAARNQARLAAARGEGPPPEAEPLDPAAFAQLNQVLSRGST
jgi:hypothetical protein